MDKQVLLLAKAGDLKKDAAAFKAFRSVAGDMKGARARGPHTCAWMCMQAAPTASRAAAGAHLTPHPPHKHTPTTHTHTHPHAQARLCL